MKRSGKRRGPARTSTVHVRYSEPELERIMKQIDAAPVFSISDFVRRLSLLSLAEIEAEPEKLVMLLKSPA